MSYQFYRKCSHELHDHVIIFTILLLFSFVKKCLVASGDLFISKYAVLRFPMQFIRTFCWLCVDARELIFALCSRLDRGRDVHFATRPACSIRVLFPPISGNFRSLLAKSCVPYKGLLKFALPCMSTEFSFSFSKYKWNFLIVSEVDGDCGCESIGYGIFGEYGR